jgi:hypothetical protein
MAMLNNQWTIGVYIGIYWGIYEPINELFLLV